MPAINLRGLRTARVRPGLDDKVLCSWNALAIGALATTARCLGRDDYAEAASAVLRYLRRVHWREGRLLAASAARVAQFNAYLDDYAFLLAALLELQSLRFSPHELQWAIELAEAMLRRFEDAPPAASSSPRTITRRSSAGRSPSLIESVPTGNAIAAQSLLKLGYLLGESRYLQAAERTLRAAWPALQQYPQAHASMLQALQSYLEPPQIVLLRGDAALLEPWQRQLNAAFAPGRWTLAIPSELTGLPEAIAGKPAGNGVLAYVCRGSVGAAPLDSLPQLLRVLNGEGA